jgi:hypothetical protein
MKPWINCVGQQAKDTHYFDDDTITIRQMPPKWHYELWHTIAECPLHITPGVFPSFEAKCSAELWAGRILDQFPVLKAITTEVEIFALGKTDEWKMFFKGWSY